jgi:hypothetical protein
MRLCGAVAVNKHIKLMNTAVCACRLRRHTLGVWTTRSQEDLRRLEDARGTRVSLSLRPLFCS